MAMKHRLSTVLRQLQPAPPGPLLGSQPNELHASDCAAAEELPPGGGWGQTYNFYKPDPSVPLYNTCKQKLLDGSKVFSCPVDRMNVEGYLEARKHWDFIFFEMQHSTLTYNDVVEMIQAGSITGEPGAHTPMSR